MGAFEDYISGSLQGLKRGVTEAPRNLLDSWKPGLVEGLKSYDGAITGTDLPYYGDDEISAAREQFDKQPRSNTSRLVDLIGNYMPGMAASKAAPVAARAGETVLGAGPAFKQKVAETALDMAPEARAQRAAEQGYTVDAFHGTSGDIPAFDLSKFGSRDPGFHGRGLYFADTGEQASGYAGRTMTGNNVIPAKLNLQNPYIRPTQVTHGDEWQKVARQEMTDMGVDWTAPDYAEKFTEALKSRGHDGVVVNRAAGGKEYVVFEPNQVRSRFAAFDPAKANSSDLLAAHANPLASLNELYRNREER